MDLLLVIMAIAATAAEITNILFLISPCSCRIASDLISWYTSGFL